MKKKLLILITLLSVSITFSQNSYKDLMNKIDDLIDIEVISIKEKEVENIITLHNNSGDVFILWEKNGDYKGKKIKIKNIDSRKSRRMTLNKNIRDSFTFIINDYEVLRNLKTDFCNPRVKKCGRLNIRVYKEGNEKIKKGFFLTFKSMKEEKKMKPFLDLYDELYDKIR